MGLILDSSVLVAAERQGQNARQMLATIAAKTSETEIGISVVTLIELAHGAAQSKAASVYPGAASCRDIVTSTSRG
jgi:predicted nucleic acid-binding protein